MNEKQASVAARIAELSHLPMAELWVLWDRYFERRPEFPNRTHVESRIAYKLQEEAFGGLAPETRQRLEAIGAKHSKIKLRARPRKSRRVIIIKAEGVAIPVERLKAISGLDEVSFHMSGTEAVMQAVRLARYHTGRKNLVRFCGAYHGWWEDVQPGPGNPLPPRETYTLRDMHEGSLKVLRTRRDIACVLVNPPQALHRNSGAPADSSLVDALTLSIRPERPCVF